MAGWRWPPSPGTGPAGSSTHPAARSWLWTARAAPHSGLRTTLTAPRSPESLNTLLLNEKNRKIERVAYLFKHQGRVDDDLRMYIKFGHNERFASVCKLVV